MPSSSAMSRIGCRLRPGSARALAGPRSTPGAGRPPGRVRGLRPGRPPCASGRARTRPAPRTRAAPIVRSRLCCRTARPASAARHGRPGPRPDQAGRAETGPADPGQSAPRCRRIASPPAAAMASIWPSAGRSARAPEPTSVHTRWTPAARSASIWPSGFCSPVERRLDGIGGQRTDGDQGGRNEPIVLDDDDGSGLPV
jgi:hypothetical protein